MTETHEIVPAVTVNGGGTAPDLSGLKLAELQTVASALGITGTGKMRKADLLNAINATQAGTSASTATIQPVAKPRVAPLPPRDLFVRVGPLLRLDRPRAMTMREGRLRPLLPRNPC